MDVESQVKAERARQRKQWGGYEHDTLHTVNDWCAFIVHQLGKVSGTDTTREEFCERMVKIAALAESAVEANQP